jgi:hypothetical protein
MNDQPEQKNRRPANGAPPHDDAFEEALDAAKVFGELAEDEPAAGADEASRQDAAAPQDAAFADEFDLRGGVARAEAALDAAEATLLERTPQPVVTPGEPEPASPAPAAAGSPAPGAAPVPAAPPPSAAPAPPGGPAEHQSIGQLFRTVVRHSPPSRIRIESNSIGALFHRFIEQE